MKAARLIVLTGIFIASGPLTAQVAFDGNYSQNFDSLVTTGSATTWENNATITGWYSSRVTYVPGTGSGNIGGLYSFGADSSTDRALGSVASNGTTTVGYGVRLQNTSGSSLDTINVSYTGEQWRNGGNTTQHSLTLWYQVGTSLSSLDLQLDTGWTSFAALDFSGPIATATAGALDGNNTANRTSISQQLTGVTLSPGQELFLRWKDVNDTGTDHGLAIDNFNITGLTVVPEPSTWALLGGGLLFLATRLRRKQ